ncbi:hypothetical protein Rs2_21526 [Raphanus sativus]|uniref:UPF0426 protein At1g28150, chloroplastic n=1 Tax=Raphanus sativus TaxID=3726 RepID=A0A9W3BT87_RAPSA|nr:UPF0426 protein At1g28150, chloroplastic [Raphanus sativus]KAJ4894732.1 hypothetical protein Rs2_21526 [Raphanus sativus]
MGLVLISSCPAPSSLVLVSRLHQFSAGIKNSAISLNHQVSPTRKPLVAKPCCFNLPQEPILSEALKEPIAFVGGVFAGLLRLDLNDEPLKEWVTRTVKASGITDEDIGGYGMASNEEESPQQIEIE